MAITDKKQGVWDTWDVYNKANQGDWTYAPDPVGLWTMGRNSYGGLGQNTQSNDGLSSPTQVGSMPAPGEQWISATSGDYFVGGVKTDGTLWSWGYAQGGCLGLNERAVSYSSPVQVGAGTDWLEAWSINSNGFALKTDGTLYAWGNNNMGNIGDGTTTQRSSPIQLPGDWSGCDVRGSFRRSGILKSDGTLWVWGDGGNGRLGFNNQTDYSSPKQLPAGSGKTWVNYAASGNTMFAAKDDGTMWAWGAGQGYALTGSNANYSSPFEMPGTGWGGPIVAFGQGGLAIKASGPKAGGLYSWGTPGTNDRSGILGQNMTQVSAAAQPVGEEASDFTWSSIQCTSNGAIHGFKTDGTLWTWGGNGYGMLGLNEGPNSEYSSPVQLPGYWNAQGNRGQGYVSMLLK